MTSTAPVYGSQPLGRGQWRVTLHNRAFAQLPWQSTLITQLDTARSRKLIRQWNQPAEFDFTMDGHSPEAKLILELATDVIVWRWNPAQNADTMMFRGIIDHSEDQLSEDAASVNFVAHDYSAMLQRRYYTVPYTVTQRDQDLIIGDWLAYASNTFSGTPFPVHFAPGSYLPLAFDPRNPDGTVRTVNSGQLRDRTYPAQTQLSQMLSDLAAVIGGFDWEVRPFGGVDGLSIYYPSQGVARTDMALQYGSTISSLTRTVASDDYANYIRLTGNTPSGGTAPMVSEQWNSDTNNVTVNPVGLWMGIDSAADVSIQSTLDDQARGDLALDGILVPSYTVTMRPGAYTLGSPNMGDTVPLIVNAGRLNVNTALRVLGITWDIGDDGQEDVSLVVGRPTTTLFKLFTKTDTNVHALARR